MLVLCVGYFSPIVLATVSISHYQSIDQSKHIF